LEEIKLTKYTSPVIKNAIYEKKLQLIKENKKKVNFLVDQGNQNVEICCYQVKEIQGIISHDTYDKFYQQT